jgi:predicted nucleic acid-binding protein
MKKIFVDSSAWIAVADPADDHHGDAAAYYLELIGRGDALVTSSDVVTETCARFQDLTAGDGAEGFRDRVKAAWQQGLLQIVTVDAEVTRKAWDIFERYHDRLSSFQHCTSFVIAGRMGIQDVFSFHPDFVTIGFRVWPRLGRSRTDLDLTD